MRRTRPGISRRYGGIHFKAGDLAGWAVGTAVGVQTWIKTEALWSGRDGNRERRDESPVNLHSLKEDSRQF
jgi:hypothetical protein